MVEAVVALGLAANIIQFIQFGSKLSSTFKAFYQSNRDSLEAVPDINILTTDLSNILTSLTPKKGHTDQAEQGFQLLIAECHEVAEQLHQLLTSLAPNGPKPGKMAALKSSWKLLWKEDDIQKLQGRLEAFRSQLLVHMVSILRVESQKSEVQQKSMLMKLDEVLKTKSSTVDYRPIDVQISLDGLGSLLVKRLVAKADAEHLPQLEQEWKTGLINSINRRGGSIDGIESNPTIPNGRYGPLQKKFLSRFAYSGMGDREFRIAEAHQQTFQWIFEDTTDANRKWSNFQEFLETDLKLYWITGKPGSGKSTLMKYISHPRAEPRYMKHLMLWAADSDLIVANYYFWNSGLEIQMSIRGLLLSLLRQLLTNHLSMIRIISPTRWESLCLFDEDDDSLSNSELENMLRLFVQNLPAGTKVFFLIDGLDEFNGDHKHLASFLVALLGNPGIKMCVASRPWTVFEETFQHSPSLMLQDLTRRDIRSYVTSTMVAEPTFSLLQKREPKYAEELIEHIVSKASGVFLWVNLVVQSLLAGISYGDRILDLERRLDQLPPDLENLYDQIMSNLDPFYLEHAAEMFQVFESFEEPPTLLLMAFADEDWKHAIDYPIRPLSEKQVDIMCDTMRRRINSRTKAFLEISRNTQRSIGDDRTLEPTVQYLHRTVRDYIKSKNVQRLLNARLRPSFDPYIQVCTAHLLQIKCLGEWSLLSAKPSEQYMSHHLPFPWPQGARPGRFWECSVALLRNAAKAHSSSQVPVVALMDELDKTGSAFCAASAEQSKHLRLMVPVEEVLVQDAPSFTAFHWYLKNNLWAPLFLTSKDKPFGGQFLSLAVRYGVTAYAQAKVERGCLIPRQQLLLRNTDSLASGEPPFRSSKGSGVHNLLLDGLTSYGGEGYDFLKMKKHENIPHWAHSDPSPAMILCLIELGADFDRKIDPDESSEELPNICSPWDALFHSFWPGGTLDREYHSNADELMSSQWRYVMELVLRQGKRPPERLIRHCFDYNRSPRDHVLIGLLQEIHAASGLAPDTFALIAKLQRTRTNALEGRRHGNSKKSSGFSAFWRRALNPRVFTRLRERNL